VERSLEGRWARRALGFGLLATGLWGAVLPLAGSQQQRELPPPPPWAYTVNPPASGGGTAAPAEATDTPLRIPGSSRSYTRAELRDLYSPPDWFPSEGDAPPEVVRQGRRPELYACGYCHYPNGQGRPENASLAGLPAPYIIQQMEDYQNGLRVTSEPRMGPPNNMIVQAKAASAEEVRAAAVYFASLSFQPWIRVVEADSVPITRVSGWMHVPVEGAGNEPLGDRIIETPERPERTALRDASSGFVAYVPQGSLARGEALVRGGAAGSQPCTLCHGDDLRGIGPVPGMAGRSPSYLVRQLYDFRSGARQGAWSGLMTAAVAELSVEDMTAIAAYLASLRP
jgi:cytochrome c553